MASEAGCGACLRTHPSDSNSDYLGGRFRQCAALTAGYSLQPHSGLLPCVSQALPFAIHPAITSRGAWLLRLCAEAVLRAHPSDSNSDYLGGVSGSGAALTAGYFPEPRSGFLPCVSKGLQFAIQPVGLPEA